MFFILIFLSGIVFSFRVEWARADSAIYIKADGSIYPTTSPISTSDNVTYTLTGNITSNNDGIIVERNNTIIDGSGYTLQGSWFSSGILITNVSGVTVRNMNIGNFSLDIEVSFSSNITLSDNNLNHTQVGIDLYFSLDSTISNNNSTGRYGLALDASSDNIVSGNNITRCYCGIFFQDSSSNTVTQNSFTENYLNIKLQSLYYPPSAAVDNIFFHNNFLLGEYGSSSSLISNYSNLTQIWNNDFEGNYWIGYNGTDSNQDGIGDTPYVIDENNTDHYTLMGSFQSFNVSAAYQKFEEVEIVSNSTFENVEFLLGMDNPQYPWEILLTVHGQNGTTGFCRITFQNDLLNSSSYPVNIAGYSTTNRIVESNGTHTTLYFTFNQTLSDYNITILPEFPFLPILSLFMIATLLVIIVHSKKHSKISEGP